MFIVHDLVLIECVRLSLSGNFEFCTSECGVYCNLFKTVIQAFVRAQIIDNIKALRLWPLWGKPPVTAGVAKGQ